MAEFSQSARDRLAAEGKAMRGGRFPIRNRSDAANAIRAVGRAKGGEQGRRKVRRYIIRRLRAINAADLKPESWNDDGSLS